MRNGRAWIQGIERVAVQDGVDFAHALRVLLGRHPFGASAVTWAEISSATHNSVQPIIEPIVQVRLCLITMKPFTVNCRGLVSWSLVGRRHAAPRCLATLT